MSKRRRPPDCPEPGCEGRLTRICQAFRVIRQWGVFEPSGLWEEQIVSTPDCPLELPRSLGLPVVICGSPDKHEFPNLEVTHPDEFKVLLASLRGGFRALIPDFELEP